MFEVRNIAFAYPSRPVLRDVSFVVSPGEAVALVGDNGAGKTTLLRVLATVFSPDSGHVLLDGQDAFASPLHYRRQLGYLPESVSLEGDMRVREYLRYRAELKGELPKRIRRRVSEAAEICRVAGILGERICELSAGLVRRVALADALLLRPRVLLLDGFLDGLDRSMRKAAGAVLADAAAFSSVVVTGHDLDSLSRGVTRFLILADGVVSASVPAAGGEDSDVVSRVDLALGGGVS